MGGVQAGSSVKGGAFGLTLGGLKGSKGTNVGGGELNGTFLQFHFRF